MTPRLTVENHILATLVLVVGLYKYPSNLSNIIKNQGRTSVTLRLTKGNVAPSGLSHRCGVDDFYICGDCGLACGPCRHGSEAVSAFWPRRWTGARPLVRLHPGPPKRVLRSIMIRRYPSAQPSMVCGHHHALRPVQHLRFPLCHQYHHHHRSGRCP